MFIGQKRIINELKAITSGLGNKSVNIILSGFAGCGKTTLARDFLANFGDFTGQYPTAQNKFLIDWNSEYEKYRGHFLDEIHLFQNRELLYPLMDRNTFIFVLATNNLILEDALLSRCIILQFEPYTDLEIAEIVFNYAKDNKFPIVFSVAEVLASFSRGSPRNAITIFNRCLFIIKAGYYKPTIKGFEAALKDIGIYEGGFTELDLRYLKLLQQSSGMSLDNIVRVLNVNKDIVTRDIEPFLLLKNKIEITSKGRICK